MHLINDNIKKLFALCRKYKVRKLYTFGPILTPKFNDDEIHKDNILIRTCQKGTQYKYDISIID